MAPIGGGPPAGFTQAATGTGTGLNYVGEHAYGQSGQITPTSGSNATAFDFVSPNNQYIVVTMTVTYDGDDVGAGEQFGYKMEFNGSTVCFARREASADDVVDNPLPAETNFLIPPNTHVQVETLTNGSGINMNLLIVGRVY